MNRAALQRVLRSFGDRFPFLVSDFTQRGTSSRLTTNPSFHPQSTRPSCIQHAYFDDTASAAASAGPGSASAVTHSAVLATSTSPSNSTITATSPWHAHSTSNPSAVGASAPSDASVGARESAAAPLAPQSPPLGAVRRRDTASASGGGDCATPTDTPVKRALFHGTSLCSAAAVHSDRHGFRPGRLVFVTPSLELAASFACPTFSAEDATAAFSDADAPANAALTVAAATVAVNTADDADNAVNGAAPHPSVGAHVGPLIASHSTESSRDASCSSACSALRGGPTTTIPSEPPPLSEPVSVPVTVASTSDTGSLPRFKIVLEVAVDLGQDVSIVFDPVLDTLPLNVVTAFTVDDVTAMAVPPNKVVETRLVILRA